MSNSQQEDRLADDEKRAVEEAADARNRALYFQWLDKCPGHEERMMQHEQRTA